MHPAVKNKWASRAVALLIFTLGAGIIVGAVVNDARAAPVYGRTISPAMPVLVIDPGHGGMDGGAVAADGTREDGINMEICLRMEALAKLVGCPVRLTRTETGLAYPDPDASVREKKAWDQKRRVAMVNETENAALLSVHQNRFPDPRPAGSQVLYAKTEGSKEFAELAQGNLTACLDPKNRRVAAPISDTIYLTRKLERPGILVECGFLSNPAELARLKSPEHQKALAAVLVSSWIQYLSL